MKQMRDEEEAREDAVEVSKAAERFKNLEAEQTEWEEKYGTPGGPSSAGHAERSMETPSTSADLPLLEFTRDSRDSRDTRDTRDVRDQRFSSTHSLLSQTRYETVAQGSPTLDVFPSARDSPREELASPQKTSKSLEDQVLEDQMRLLDEVKRARMEVRSSIDKLRSQTPTLSLRDGNRSGASTPTMDKFAENSRRISGTSSRMLDHPVSILEKPSPTQSTFGGAAATTARLSPQQQAPKNEWDQYVSNRNIVSPVLPSTGLQSRPQSSYDLQADDRRVRTTSLVDTHPAEFGGDHRAPGGTPIGTYPPRDPTRRDSGYTMPRPTSNYELLRPASTYDTPPTNRNSYAPGMIVGSAAQSGAPTRGGAGSQPMPRAMTYEELADRHRKRISKLQDPVSSKMKEEVQLAAAKEKWEKQRRVEREEMRKREAEKLERAKEREREREGGGALDNLNVQSQRPRKEVLKTTDEWRRSVAGGLDGMTGNGSGSGQGQQQQQQQQRGQMLPPALPNAMAGKGKRRMSSHMAN